MLYFLPTSYRQKVEVEIEFRDEAEGKLKRMWLVDETIGEKMKGVG